MPQIKSLKPVPFFLFLVLSGSAFAEQQVFKNISQSSCMSKSRPPLVQCDWKGEAGGFFSRLFTSASTDNSSGVCVCDTPGDMYKVLMKDGLAYKRQGEHKALTDAKTPTAQNVAVAQLAGDKVRETIYDEGFLHFKVQDINLRAAKSAIVKPVSPSDAPKVAEMGHFDPKLLASAGGSGDNVANINAIIDQKLAANKEGVDNGLHRLADANKKSMALVEEASTGPTSTGQPLLKSAQFDAKIDSAAESVQKSVDAANPPLTGAQKKAIDTFVQKVVDKPQEKFELPRGDGTPSRLPGTGGGGEAPTTITQHSAPPSVEEAPHVLCNDVHKQLQDSITNVSKYRRKSEKMDKASGPSSEEMVKAQEKIEPKTGASNTVPDNLETKYTSKSGSTVDYISSSKKAKVDGVERVVWHVKRIEEKPVYTTYDKFGQKLGSDAKGAQMMGATRKQTGTKAITFDYEFYEQGGFCYLDSAKFKEGNQPEENLSKKECTAMLQGVGGWFKRMGTDNRIIRNCVGMMPYFSTKTNSSWNTPVLNEGVLGETPHVSSGAGSSHNH